MLSLSLHDAIDEIAAADWNRLVDPDTPFLRHEFLAAMERHGCVGTELGWIPRHLALRDQGGVLVAAAPCYLKLNSYGELVFDWAWADAYRRSGLRYYPKLVVASPYTPATGPRILTGDSPLRPRYAETLIRAATEVAQELGVSSLHWLFPTEEETQWLEQGGLMRRIGCQFHWENRGYGVFDDLLGDFSAPKRKGIKRERRRVAEAGIQFRLLRGGELDDGQWRTFHALYRSTFDKRGGIPTLSLDFFREIGRTMGDHLLLVLAYHHGEIVAAAFDLIGSKSLYGRHWGCFEELDALHFEACYYQGLEFCIDNGLQRFEPGAQGEHKVARGFLPTPTWSAHWIADPRMGQAIGRFLEHEREGMADYIAEMHQRSPFKAGVEPR
ncbi:MAG: GNAT family N-acetyltransferase [Chromatiaceae bacterium]|jgi:predicted N-acyltransferase|nr:GNAT family N-acetyltransferase [Chromatiaceae bacterium]